MASATVCVRLRVPSFACAFLKWLRTRHSYAGHPLIVGWAAPRALIGRCLPQLGSPCPQRTTLGSRDAPPRALQGIGARRVGKVAKVVYAYRGPKMMDSMCRWLRVSVVQRLPNPVRPGAT